MSEPSDRWFTRPYSNHLTGVTEFVLNAPEEGNRLTTAMMSRLADAVESTGSASSCRAIVLSAAGEDFCLGRAAAGPGLGFAPGTAHELISEIEGSLMRLFGVIRDAPVPVLAIVSGRAVGFGCALAVSCDLTLAGPAAAFQLDEMAHGKPPLMALSTLAGRVSEKVLAAMVYTTAPIVGADAVAAGLVSVVADTEADLTARTERILEGLLAMPAASIITVKQYLLAAADITPRARARLALAMFANAITG